MARVPIATLKPMNKQQKLIKVVKHSIATLICFELAFPNLLRQQLPKAEWLVSISDDGWFGHSLAPYQHVQMAQALSRQLGAIKLLRIMMVYLQSSIIKDNCILLTSI